MSMRQTTCYWIACDWPGCGVNLSEQDVITCWAEPDHAQQMVEDSGHRQGTGRVEWYCGHHPATWASDHEHDEPYPDPPYLLIHDGDTSDPLNDDCKVTLVAEATHR